MFTLFTICLIALGSILALVVVVSMHDIKRLFQRIESDSPEHSRWLLLLRSFILIYGILVGAYFVMRYDARWVETDTASLTRAIEVMSKEARLVTEEYRYFHGYNYQALSTAVLALTGLRTQLLQSSVYPYIAGLIVVITALAFYRHLSGGRLTAILATLFLFFQPDMLFVTMRGSHEKLDWPLMMVGGLLLYRSLKQPLKKVVTYVILFYMVIFAMITTNTFFASSLVVAFLISLILGVVVSRFIQKDRTLATEHLRLIYVCLSSVVLVYVFIVYLYPPALTNLHTLKTVWDQISVLLLSFEPKTQPYDYISFGWISPQVFIGLTLFTWTLIGASFIEWCRRAIRYLRKQDRLDLRAGLDWLLYAGFALQIGISIIVDFSGALAGNLQLRILPGFTVIAAGVLARGVHRILRQHRFNGWKTPVLYSLTLLLSAWFALASVLKATNEPAFSNKWSFHTAAEEATIRWFDTRINDSNVWTGLDERLRETYRFQVDPLTSSENVYGSDNYRLDLDYDYAFVSTLERQRSERIQIEMPDFEGWNQVFDNGEVRVQQFNRLNPIEER